MFMPLAKGAQWKEKYSWIDVSQPLAASEADGRIQKLPLDVNKSSAQDTSRKAEVRCVSKWMAR